MPGLAQRLFQEKYCAQNPTEPRPWNELESLVELGRLDSIDLALAEHILEQPSSENLGKALVIAYLSQSVRSGQLCLDRESDPRKSCLLPLNEDSDVDLAALYELFSQQIQTPQPLFDHPLVVEERGRYYFRRHWKAREVFLRHWKRLSTAPAEFSICSQLLDQEIQELIFEGRLGDDQALAIRKAASHGVTLISGGPGTGKTYTAGLLIKLLLDSIPEERKEQFSIALAAPTGKAAAMLQASLERAVGSSILSSTTLHRLLGLKGWSCPLESDRELSADLILVDESSMIDIQLMARLFAQVKTGARLILLGDRDQLPPVEAGGVFSDLSKDPSVENLVAKLQVSRRSRNPSIPRFSTAINQGDLATMGEVFADANSQITLHSMAKWSHDWAKKMCLRASSSPEQALEHFESLRLLSPLRQGPQGVDALNQTFLELCLAAGSTIAPIMITKNSEGMGLFNGDVGIVLRQAGTRHGPFQAGDRAYFRSAGQVREIPAVLLPPFTYAYCLSVHKSQGSEFNHVLLLLPEGSEVFGKELLYTAVTRAKEKIDVYADEGVIPRLLAYRERRIPVF